MLRIFHVYLVLFIFYHQAVEELIRSLNYEQAKAVIIPGNGVNSGKTMGQLAIENPASLEWYVRSYKGPNNLLRAAAQVLLQQAA